MEICMRILDHFNSFTTRVMVSLLTFVTLGIIVVSALAYGLIDANSQQNMAIRLDRAARAAALITIHRLAGTFSVERTEDGQPRLIHMAGEALPWKVDTATAFNDLVLEIGTTNQGAANFFVWNETTLAFDRFATTFRRPDGSMPPYGARERPSGLCHDQGRAGLQGECASHGPAALCLPDIDRQPGWHRGRHHGDRCWLA
jgi:hypothetical protein